jgi:hypothetical protein
MEHDQDEDEGRIARLIKNAQLEDSSGEETGDAAAVTKKAMIADGWVAADESNMPSLPPMRPPPLLPPRMEVPDIFDTKIGEYSCICHCLFIFSLEVLTCRVQHKPHVEPRPCGCERARRDRRA